MKTKVSIKHDQAHKENLVNRKGLKVLQQSASGKENLVGRRIIDKDSKLASTIEKHEKPKQVEDKGVQTGESIITEEDLTSDEPSADYWKKLAEQRQSQLNDSFKENERLNDLIEALTEENKICNDMLNESRCLVEVLQEMIQDETSDAAQPAEEVSEES